MFSAFATVILFNNKNKNSRGKFAMGVWRRGAALMSVLESLGLYFSLATIFLKTQINNNNDKKPLTN